MKYREEYFDFEKNIEQEWKKEHKAGGFKCSHCKRWVVINNHMGTINRNHCNMCLWSKHVDEQKGDRKAECQGGMKPIGLTFKYEGVGRQGELMLIHECANCEKISINRIAGDDAGEAILLIFEESLLKQNILDKLRQQGVALLTVADKVRIGTVLFGKK